MTDDIIETRGILNGMGHVECAGAADVAPGCWMAANFAWFY